MVSIHGRFGIRSWLSLIFGLLLLAVSGIPVLNDFELIDFTLPALPDFLLRIVVLVAGVLLLWDAKYEVFTGRAWMWLSIVFGIPVFILGLMPVLNSYAVLDFTLDFIPALVYNVLTALGGILLFFDAWKSE